MCLVTFIGVQVTGGKYLGYNIFLRVNLEWIEWMWHLPCNHCLCRVKNSCKTQNNSVLSNYLCIDCTSRAQRFVGQNRYFRQTKNSVWHRYCLNAALWLLCHFTLPCPDDLVSLGTRCSPLSVSRRVFGSGDSVLILSRHCTFRRPGGNTRRMVHCS